MSQYDPQGSQPRHYPGAAPPPGQRPSGAPVAMPRQVALAVNLLFAIIALAVVALILMVARGGASGRSLAALGSIVSIALYVWLTLMIRKGASWARIVITVLFAIGLLPLLVTFLLPVLALVKVLALVQLVIEIAVVVLLWRAPSSAYFAGHDRPA
jgi:lysylphosphatidylglycerol synthetase-like protein (DUF2156 family)